MATSQQRISLLQVKIETLESKVKKMEKMIDNYYSVLSCEYWYNGKSMKLSQVIVELIKKSDAILGAAE